MRITHAALFIIGVVVVLAMILAPGIRTNLAENKRLEIARPQLNQLPSYSEMTLEQALQNNRGGVYFNSNYKPWQIWKDGKQLYYAIPLNNDPAKLEQGLGAATMDPHGQSPWYPV